MIIENNFPKTARRKRLIEPFCGSAALSLALEFDEYYLVTQYVPNVKRELERLDYRMVWEEELKKYFKKTTIRGYLHNLLRPFARRLFNILDSILAKKPCFFFIFLVLG